MRDLAERFHASPGARRSEQGSGWVCAWRTSDELAFLRRMVAQRLRGDAIAFLESYLAGARRRFNWHPLSRHEVIGTVEELLAGLRRAA